MRVRRRYVLALAVIFGLFAAACGDSAKPLVEGGASGGTGAATTTVAAPADPAAILKYGSMQATSLDPVKQGTPCEVSQMRLIYDTLTHFDRANKLGPMLATSWTLDTPTQITMKLRTDVKFQDGTPFNADAVKFNIDRVLTDPASNTKSGLAMLDNVAVVDASTVKFTMKTPAAAPMLAALSDRWGMMISPTAYKNAGSQDAFNKAPVGSGKFKVVGEWRPVESLSLRAWDGYWDTSSPKLGGMDLTDVKVDALVNAINSGQMDLVPLDSTSQIAGVKGQPNIVVKVDPPPVPQLRTFLLNETVPPLDNPKVRQAIAYALNRDAIADVMTDGQQKGIYQWFPEGSLPYDPALNSTYKYDKAKAKQLLTDAGFPNGFDLKAVIGSSSTSYIQQGEIIQAQLKEVGINMTLDKIDTAQMVPTVYTAGPNKTGSAIAAPWGASLTSDPDTVLRRNFVAGGPTNNGGEDAPGVKDLLDKAAASTNETERANYYKQVEKIITEGVYEGVPLFYVPAIMAFKDYVAGITQAETRCPASFLRDAYITQGKVPATKK